MKHCPRCKEEKSLEEFGKNNSRKDGKQTYCLSCMRAINTNSYHKFKERYYQRSKDRDKQIDELINKYKRKPCADCGGTFPPYVMDFDHLGKEPKKYKIATMRRRRMRFDLIEKEIAKCEVVCANCHRKRTNERSPARYSK